MIIDWFRNEQKVQNNNVNNIPVASSNTNTNINVTSSSNNTPISPTTTTSVSPSTSSSVISPSLSNQTADSSLPSPIQSQQSYPNVAPIQNYSPSSTTSSPSVQEPISYPSTVLTPPSSSSVNTPTVHTSNTEQTNQFVSYPNPFVASNVATPPVTSPPPSTLAPSHAVHSIQVHLLFYSISH